MGILLTGASGFLGRNIIAVLDKEIITLGRSKDSDIIVDLGIEIPNLPDVQLVIHAAGKAHVIPKTEQEKKEFEKSNVTGTQNLLLALEKNILPRQFVYISSVSVYGLDSGTNISEDCTLSAKDPYGLSKIAAEKLVSNWCVHNNVVCTILRLPLLVGSNAPGNLGAMVNAIEKGYYFNIGGGISKKSMVLATDVARFIAFAAPIGGVYNLTDGLHPDFKELSSAIAINKKKRLPFNIPLRIAKILGILGDLVGDKSPISSLKVSKITSTLTFDDSKARAIKNWKPESVLEFLKESSL